jgi:hypothetical protein
MARIFIQIASYRDPELLKTIANCLDHAANPQNLRFGICEQWAPEDQWGLAHKLYKDHPQFKFVAVPWQESRGVCWARNSIQENLYDGEEYTLCIDSHHRFAQGWDEQCILWVQMLQAKGHRKPLLTSYVTAFDPKEHTGSRDLDYLLNPVPYRLTFDRFTPEGCVFMMPAFMENWQEIHEPEPNCFYSGHFAFTIGDFVREVPHDPNYYFHGEEISIAARAYTWGYDMFCPHRTVCWHEYTRAYRENKHWGDHTHVAKPQLADNLAWHERNDRSHHRNRVLFGMEEDPSIDFGKYGFGKERTLEEYGAVAKLNFKKRCRILPDGHFEFAVKMEWGQQEIQQGCDDVDLLVMAIDEVGYRQDVTPSTFPHYFNLSVANHVARFAAQQLPTFYTLLPHSVSKGWLTRINKPIQSGY